MRRVIAQPDGETVRITVGGPRIGDVPLISVYRREEAWELLQQLTKPAVLKLITPASRAHGNG